MTIAAAIGHRLRLKVFSFVVGIETDPIEEGEPLTGDGD
jgi:hypothetical protein